MGIGVLMVAVMGTSVRHVSSAVFAILFLLSLTAVKDWFKIFKSLSGLEKIFLVAFSLYTLAGVLSYYNVDDVDKYYRLFERYLRFILIIPVYLLVIRNGVSLMKYLYAGAIISGPFLVVIAISHYIAHPDAPAQGYYHHIIFGQLAMLNVGIMLSLLLTRKMDRRYQLFIMMSMVCGMLTAVMSQARGVWLVFPAYVLIAGYYVVKEKHITAKSLSAVLVTILIITVLTPIGGLIIKRTEMAVSEINNFYTSDQYVNSVGGRLAMWDISIDVWQKHPVLGTGPGDIDDEIQSLQDQGIYAGMDLHNSVHNIYLQALVGSGMVGLLAMLFAVVIMPLKIFLGRTVVDRESQLTGLVTIISFSIFGLSESWTMRLSSISIFLIYCIVIVSHIYIVNARSK
jgi:O-antigen ligase